MAGAEHTVIEELGIRDLGVIADATLPLGPGFTAVTGETGAGKTMVVTALGLVLGARSDAGAVRAGQPEARVDGRWLVDEDGSVAERARDAGGSLDGPELLLSRSVSSEGRSRAYVGGRSAPVSVLGDLAEQLVVVHGQSDQIRLRSASAQRDALDRFAGAELAAVLADYRAAFERWRADMDALRDLSDDRERRAREAEDLRIALAEIADAEPLRGEDVELTERAERLGNLEELRLAAAQAREWISAEQSDEAIDAVRRHRVGPAGASIALLVTTSRSRPSSRLSAPSASSSRTRLQSSRPTSRASMPTAPANSNWSRSAGRCSARWCASTAPTSTP